jgi:outer membrane protein TolC
MNKRLAFVLICLALSGCVNQAQEVATYQKQLDALPGATLPVPKDSSPLTLQAALRLAEKNDESLGLSGETYLQALIARDKAFSAFLPTIAIGPNFTWSRPTPGFITQTTTTGGKTVTSVSTISSDSYSVPLTANITVNPVQNEAQVEQDTSTAEQNRQLLLNEQQTIMLDVVTAYYLVLTNERQVVVYQSSLAEQEERVRQAEAQYRVGSGTPLSIAQSQSLASGTRVSLVNAQASVITSRAALQYLIGVPVETRPLTDGFQPPADLNQPMPAWLADAERHRQDLLAANAAVDAARLGVRAAFGEFLPSITLDPSYLIYASTPPVHNWNFGLSVNIPIFSANSDEQDLRNAYSVLRAAVLSQSQARKQVEEDIRTQWADLDNARQQIKELRVELQAAADALVYSQKQALNGLAINLDVLTAEATLLSTQLQLATEIYQEKITYLNLLRVAGRLDLLSATPSTQPTTEPASKYETTTPKAIP